MTKFIWYFKIKWHKIKFKKFEVSKNCKICNNKFKVIWKEFNNNEIFKPFK
ncbi:hypothetical protein [Spiroplasma ixodetis]|uniref:hypothetical protein n=1 Tax=Spiroplasma ixodetis TaxID=2141 RepID=UPI0025752F09|nr:hypothetical protein [Spiroplasma ixodetis]WJG70696.1 hypothetical protein SIXOD_v1c19110 [Spiroplasma ixodetis Y32]